ncbi:hypothetical protein ACFLWW_03740, partial [Chloroflexota bacterium]
YQSMPVNLPQLAATDGIVVAWAKGSSSNDYKYTYVRGGIQPYGSVDWTDIVVESDMYDAEISITFPVKAGDYWFVLSYSQGTHEVHVWWMPIGN